MPNNASKLAADDAIKFARVASNVKTRIYDNRLATADARASFGCKPEGERRWPQSRRLVYPSLLLYSFGWESGYATVGV